MADLGANLALVKTTSIELRTDKSIVEEPRASSEGSIGDRDIEKGDPEKSVLEKIEENGAATVEAQKDSNIVDWDGENDPEKPLNWPARKKWTNVALLASLTLLTPFGSSVIAPGVPDAMVEFRSNNIDLASFIVSVYILGYAFGPLVIAPMSELYGRVPVYHINTILFLLFNIGCAKAPNLSALIVFRFLSGVAGSCPITIGSGSIADCFRQHERGKVMSVWTFPVLLGPTLGPVLGGYLSQGAGWRWTFWFVVIATGVILILTLLCMRETYPPVLLERKAARMRKETGNIELRSALKSSKTPLQLFMISIIRPTKMLFMSPIVFGLSMYIAVAYGYLYLMFATMTSVFEDVYGISSGNVGLTYLGIGVGNFAGVILFALMSDKLLKRLASKHGGEQKPEYRLPPMYVGATALPIGFLIYGWTAQYKIHWIVPIIGTALIGFGNISLFMPIGTYLVDAFTIYAASAMAANTVLRSLGGALLPLAGRQMYNTLGLGWGNTLLAFIAIALLPVIWVFNQYGEKIRTHPKYQLNL